MLSVVHEFYIPNRVLAVVEASNENTILYQRSEIIRNMKAHGAKLTTAHVCCNRECLSPVTSVDELKTLLTQKFDSIQA